MTSSFLKSRHNKFIILFCLIILSLILCQAFVSGNLPKYKPKIVNYLTGTLGYRLTIDNLSFSFINGLKLKGVSIFYNNQDAATISIKEADASFKILPLFLGKIAIAKIRIKELTLWVKKEQGGLNIQIIFSDIYKRILEKPNLSANLNTNRIIVYLDRVTINYIDNPYFAKNMLILLKNSRMESKAGKFKFNGEIKIKYRLLPDKIFISRFLKNDLLEQQVKCAVQGYMQGTNLNMDMIQLNIGKEELIGMGVNKNFAERNPYLEVNFIPATLSLNNIAFMKDNFNADGNIFVTLKIYGLMDGTKISLAALMQNCSLRYHIASGEIFDIKNIGGEFGYKEGALRLDNAYFRFNDLPLNFKWQLELASEPEVYFNLSIPEDFLFAHIPSINKVEAEFKGKIKKTLVGNLKFRALYVRKDLNLDLSGYFNNVDFDYFNPQEKYFRADTLELVKGSTYKIQKLNFTNLESKFHVSKNRFEIKDIRFLGYNGVMKGDLGIDVGDRASLILALTGDGFDVKPLMQDINVTNKLLSGTMAAKIMFDNRLEEFLKGECHIDDGIVSLDELATYLGLASLKNKQFNKMYASFAISKYLTRLCEATLNNPDIMLNAHWDANSKIDGEIAIKIASELLKESWQFRKLLSLTKIEKDFIDFRFLLGGAPKAVRFMWMKDEFKEKLKQKLPYGIQKAIQNSLDETINAVSGAE